MKLINVVKKIYHQVKHWLAAIIVAAGMFLGFCLAHLQFTPYPLISKTGISMLGWGWGIVFSGLFYAVTLIYIARDLVMTFVNRYIPSKITNKVEVIEEEDIWASNIRSLN